MNWLWILIGVYVASGVAILLYRIWVCADEDDNRKLRKIRTTIAQKPMVNRGFLLAVVTIVMLICGIFMPPMFAWEFLSEWILSRLGRKLLKRRCQQFREVLMEPIAFCSMHPVAQQYIDRFEKRIADLNFRRINNYLYKPAPLLIETRIYLSADCQSILSIGHCDGNAYYAFESFLNNGIFVETSVCSGAMDVNPFNSVGKCYLQAFSPKDGEDLESILARHEALVQQLRRDTCQQPIRIPTEYVTDAIRYVNRKFFEIKYDLGQLDERPPLAVWPITASANAV